MFKDNALTAFTDALLENQAMELTEDLQDLEGVVRRLQQTIQPMRPPDAAFRSRLTQRLNEEWNRTERQQRIQRLRTQRTLRYVASAAAVLLLATVAVLLSGRVNTLGASGDSGANQNWIALLVVGLITAAVVATFYFWNNRRHHD